MTYRRLGDGAWVPALLDSDPPSMLGGRWERPSEPCRGELLVAPSGRRYRVLGWTPDADAVAARCCSDGRVYAVPYLHVRDYRDLDGSWRLRDPDPDPQLQLDL